MRTYFRFALLSTLLIGASHGALAQAENPVVVVTPLKAARKLDSVPMAVTQISGGALNRVAAQSVDDIIHDIPNVEGAGGPRSAAEEPSIRGLSDRRVVIKVDGIRRNFRAQYGGRYFIDPWMIDTAEVVRGGNSSIDGSGAVGGVLQFFTPDARQELAGQNKNWGVTTRAGFQNNDSQRSEIVTGYTTYGNFDGLVSQSFRDAGSIRTGNGVHQSPGETQQRNLLAKVGYSFSDTHRLELRAAEYNDRAEVPASPFQPVSSINTPTDRISHVTDISARYRLAPQSEEMRNLFDVTAIVYHSEYDIDTTRVSDKRYDETDFVTTGYDMYNTSSFNFGSALTKLTIGNEYYQNKQTGKRNGGFRPLLGDGRDSNTAFYAQYELPLPTGLTLTPGIRYDHYELTPGDSTLPSNTKNQFSPKLGANWKFNENWSGFASVGKSFRTPTLTELYATGTIFPGNNLISNPNLRPEVALTKEIGVRYKVGDALFKGDTFNTSFSVFENDIDNYIEQVVGFETTQYRNVTTARLVGFEAEAKYTLDGWVGKLSYGRVAGKNQTLDAPLADVPPMKFVGVVEKDLFDDRSLKLGSKFTHYDSQKSIPPGQQITASKSANTVDVYASWLPSAPALQGLRVNVGVDNVFDEDYRRYLAFVPEQGRNVKVDLTWKF